MSDATMTATILIVEDDVAVRELLVLSLEANAFGAIAAANATDALAHLQSRHVDLLLLDLRLGNESGVDLLKVIRRLPEYEKLPVILLTGCANRNTVLEIAQLGVQGYILKHQFSRKDLVERIHQQLNKCESAFSAAADEPFVHATDNAAVMHSEPDTPSIDLLRSVTPLVTHAQTIEQIDRCVELKALSPTVAQLMRVTAEPDCSFDQVARVIKTDQGIALKILRIANSVLYSSSAPVDSLQLALSRIGISRVRQLVLGMAVIDNFHTHGLSEHFSTELFWEHSIATGLIAMAITRSRNGDKQAADFAFTMGLLHDVGRMVLIDRLDDVYKRVLDTANHLQLPLEQIESRMLQIHHADAARRLLTSWNFPKRLVDAIAMHHLSLDKIRGLAPQTAADVATLALADRLAHALLLGSSGNDCQYPTEELVRMLELTADGIKLIEDQSPQQTADVKYSILKSDEAPAAANYRQRLLNAFRQPFHPLYVSASPAIDGHRILLQCLGEIDRKIRPNIAILMLAHMADAELLFGLLKEREAGIGVKPLPVVIVSPLPAVSLDPKFIASREVRKIPSPFTLARLTDIVNSLLLSGGE